MNNYKIGQYRYDSNYPYMDLVKTPQDFGVQYFSLEKEENSIRFQDIKIGPMQQENVPQPQIKKNNDYLLNLSIPQHPSFIYDINIKLINDADPNNAYQFLKRITVNKGQGNDEAQMVVLYNDPFSSEATQEALRVGLPQQIISGGICEPGKLYWRGSVNKREYFICGEDGAEKKITKYNDMYMSAPWLNKEDATDKFLNFDIIFRPVQDFDSILVEIIRTPEDYNIQQDGYIGRVIPITETATNTNIFRYKLYQINNILGKNNPIAQKNLSKIGIWGRQDLPLCINGEEIHVGFNEHYEMDVIPITSIGVAIPQGQPNTYFTIDYTYLPDLQK